MRSDRARGRPFGPKAAPLGTTRATAAGGVLLPYMPPARLESSVSNLIRLLSDWGLADWGLVIPQNSAKFRKKIRKNPQNSGKKKRKIPQNDWGLADWGLVIPKKNAKSRKIPSNLLSTKPRWVKPQSLNFRPMQEVYRHDECHRDKHLDIFSGLTKNIANSTF